jgi:threonine dehydrogenase-like Zn-dependent dehydrogenase
MRALAQHSASTPCRTEILNPRDAIIRITSTAICGSDLHLYDGVIPTLASGDILGHEFMGEVVDAGPGVTSLRAGDRVVVPFTIACGACEPCRRNLWALCDNSNPNAWLPEKLYGHSASGLFGYSHMYGGYAGGQAEYVRVPFADVGPVKVPPSLSDDQVLFLSDILPTGFMAAENCSIERGHVVAVWGAGPVGLFAMKSAMLLGAERVIAIDRVPERLALAQEACGARSLRRGRADEPGQGRAAGSDSCIDAVASKPTVRAPLGALRRREDAVRLATDRLEALRQPPRLQQGRHGLDLASTAAI